MPLKKNQDIELHIDSFTSEGSGVGRYENMAVFVSGAAVGDTVVAHIIKVKKSYAVGKVQKVLVPSKIRTVPVCPVFPSCGGCAFQHISYEAEKEHKLLRVADAFSRLAHIDISPEEILSDNCVSNYRNKAEYPVSFDKELKIGFYAPRTHRVVNCQSCALQPEIFGDIIKIFRRWIVKNAISVYNAETGKGLLRHIYLRRAAVTGEIMVCAVINGDTLAKSEELIAELQKTDKVTSIVININRGDTNVILGKTCKTLWGKDYITDYLCGVKIRLSPLSFYQINHDMAEKLYERAAEYACLTGKETVLDLYCGAGTIGLSMANKAKKVIGVEIIPEAVADARLNAAENDISNAEFICGDASAAAEELKERKITPDVVLLDPPRKGCAAELLNTVSEMEPQKIVYVSCDPSTLARDCKILEDKGYKTEKLTAVDLFPRTVHVESVALLIRI